MGIFKTLFISAAVYGAYKFLTESDQSGRTRLDTIKEKAAELLETEKTVKEELQAGMLPEAGI